MRYYIQAHRQDGSQVLGNLDGQASLNVKDYKRTNHYFNLKHGITKVMKDIHHWKVVDEANRVLETIKNINFVPALTSEQIERGKLAKTKKYGGDDLYSWALFIGGRVTYTGMSRSEATWRKKRYITTGEL